MWLQQITSYFIRNIFYSEASMIEWTIEVPRTVHHQTTRDNIPANSNSQFELECSNSPEQYYKRSEFFTFLDQCICKLKNIFINHNLVMSKLQSHKPTFLNTD